jgi:4-amino-4-deoxychorismate lyase
VNVTAAILVDGEWSERINASDRGLMYGDGVFRTLRMEQGFPVWLESHLARLEADALRLAISAPAAWLWQDDIDRLAERYPTAVVKLVLTRGVSARGYRPDASIRSTRIALASPARFTYSPAADGIIARVGNLRLGIQPRLAGIKHLNRLENVLARMEWDDPKIPEAILMDIDGRVVGGTQGNLFLLRGDGLFTPRIDRAGVAGVTRERLIAAAPGIGLRAVEADFDMDAVMSADALFFSNSLIKLSWVQQLGERAWSRPDLYPALLDALHD